MIIPNARINPDKLPTRLQAVDPSARLKGFKLA
jgi:hypothetical protein